MVTSVGSTGHTNHAKASLLKADSVSWAPQPVRIPPPGTVSEFGKLTLQKENGTVKGFEYQCVCGHKDYFVCE